MICILCGLDRPDGFFDGKSRKCNTCMSTIHGLRRDPMGLTEEEILNIAAETTRIRVHNRQQGLFGWKCEPDYR